MRNVTVSVTDETCKIARICAAQRDRSLSSIVEYLLCTLPNIHRVRNFFSVPAINNFGQISQISTPATTTNSTTSTPKPLKKPTKNTKLRVKLWTPLQPQQNSPLKIAHSTASQP
jgi:hypothetical protein